MAVKSLEFNLKDKIVAELFPEVCEEMRRIHETRLKTLESSGIQSKLLCTSSGGSSGSQGSSSNYHNAIATAAVLIGFAIFAYSVKYVLKTMAYEE